ncbi:MAG: hypothetical protein EOP06_16245 [Proteobacteria bacterium]|nr:MAG: hypothetical protein EOP06_16245 [Pseudomonadota bacterium]
MEEVGFLGSLYNSSATMWNASAVRNISKQQFPEQLLGSKKYLLRSDIFEQWSSWFIEGLVDPISYSTSNKGYTYIYADALKAITNLFPHNSQNPAP